ncbi:crotonase/enoyl-CoA hydratase family protein [Brevundimonas sp.]|jgi:enoyl-CoA hydratase/carnithine racemase|uniref:crotonase/enoyl-CoA hydratase family protein n=1 Tax=Brevundimonas sp. TaxID=1871086 RepID=UPI002EDAD812
MAGTITIEDRGHVRLIGLNRPEKRNAFTFDMLAELARAYTDLADAPEIRCGVLFAHGAMFTAGLDLADVAPRVAAGDSITGGARIDPWGLYAERCPKPMVVAVHGKCLTLGIELALAAEIVVADESATFAQIEVARGIFPFGGATIRMARAGGYQNAMRWLLTGDEFNAEQARQLGLVQEIVAPGQALERAVEIAQRIAAQAPLGVAATLKSARLAQQDPEAAASTIYDEVRALMGTEDARAAVTAFVKRETPVFTGR